MSRMIVMLITILLVFTAISAAQNSDRIYGKIYTVDGDEYEGLIRWDKNEGSWVDVLNGSRDRYRDSRDHRRDRRRRESDRNSRIKIFGITIGHSNSIGWNSGMAESGIRFGHLRSLEPTGNDEALLVLKSGKEIEFEGGSTDIGDGIREIIIEDDHEGEIELEWDDIELIEFSAASSGERSSYGDRLYGTMKTRRGEEFTGSVCWDTDELFTSDILDGDEGRQSRRIKFGKIEAIERYSSSGARVLLKSGDEVILKGSNDVNRSNRGIAIMDRHLGMVTVEWDEFDRLNFKENEKTVKYNEFDGGEPLYGTVYADDGESYTGSIRWDDDEEYTWEILDGSHRGITFDIEFGMIKSIKRKSSRGSIVTLSDGREFRLSDSNDVDEDNKGIYITLEDGDEIEIDWYDFDRVEFTKK